MSGTIVSTESQPKIASNSSPMLSFFAVLAFFCLAIYYGYLYLLVPELTWSQSPEEANRLIQILPSDIVWSNLSGYIAWAKLVFGSGGNLETDSPPYNIMRALRGWNFILAAVCLFLLISLFKRERNNWAVCTLGCALFISVGITQEAVLQASPELAGLTLNLIGLLGFFYFNDGSLWRSFLVSLPFAEAYFFGGSISQLELPLTCMLSAALLGNYRHSCKVAICFVIVLAVGINYFGFSPNLPNITDGWSISRVLDNMQIVYAWPIWCCVAAILCLGNSMGSLQLNLRHPGFIALSIGLFTNLFLSGFKAYDSLGWLNTIFAMCWLCTLFARHALDNNTVSASIVFSLLLLALGCLTPLFGNFSVRAMRINRSLNLDTQRWIEEHKGEKVNVLAQDPTLSYRLRGYEAKQEDSEVVQPSDLYLRKFSTELAAKKYDYVLLADEPEQFWPQELLNSVADHYIPTGSVLIYGLRGSILEPKFAPEDVHIKRGKSLNRRDLFANFERW